MKYNKVFLFIFLATGLQLPIPAEEVFRYPLKPETIDAFKITCARLAEHPFIKGDFEQEKMLKRHNRPLKSSGNFIIAAEMGMVWITVEPFPSTLTLGKDYLIQYRPSARSSERDGGQRTVLSARGNETFLRMAEVLSALFSGRSQGLLDNFEIFYTSGGGTWELGLSPRDGVLDSFAEKIIMKGDTVIKSIHLYQQNGDSVHYILSNHSYPAELNAHEKTFFDLP